MSGVLIHDGRVIGHRKWSSDAVAGGHAEGIVVTPFATPRIAEPRHPSASTLAEDMEQVAGAFIFDPMTHVRMLPTTNRDEFYDQWDLWGGAAPNVDTPAARAAHVERVFEIQGGLGAPPLAPTLCLSSPSSADADKALKLAQTARGMVRATGQSLVGTHQFWSSGAALDGYIGSLAALRAPVWFITLANQAVLESEPDLSDIDAHVGLCRTIRSLSRRSQVVLCYSDFPGLLGVAAGADTVGTGWHRAQRTFDPRSSSWFYDADPGIKRQAENVTQGLLHAVLRRETADQIVRYDPARADSIRGAPMPPSANVERMHHLQQLTDAISEINSHTSARDRYVAMSDRYTRASDLFDDLIRGVPSMTNHDKRVWNSQMSAVLDAYAVGEGF